MTIKNFSAGMRGCDKITATLLLACFNTSIQRTLTISEALSRPRSRRSSMPNITFKEAAHLLRRMGFNAPTEDIDSMVGLTREQAVSRLLNYRKIDASSLEAALS